MNHKITFKVLLTCGLMISSVVELFAQERSFPYSFTLESPVIIWVLLVFFVCIITFFSFFVNQKAAKMLSQEKQRRKKGVEEEYKQFYLNQLNVQQIKRLLSIKKKKNILSWILVVLSVMPFNIYAQTDSSEGITRETIFGQLPVVITILLILIPIIFAIVFLFIKTKGLLSNVEKNRRYKDAKELAQFLQEMPAEKIEKDLVEKEKSLLYTLRHDELSGAAAPKDERGILKVLGSPGSPVVSPKKRAVPRPKVNPELSKLVVWYLISATFWLLFGTTVGEYIGIKFVAPELDSASWLSFGRLRPVHTNAVFWGWASLGMLGLAYYCVPRVGNAPLFSIKLGWYALHLINATVLLGSISLMAGVNNGGGEYREYIWPIMLLFGVALGLTLYNFLKTIAGRKTGEIYISNWYIVSAIMFVLVIALVAYLPFWQKGLGETIVQGYYMHQGVGMWFMMFTLGLVYYFLPQQLNQPIYSYSLGVLAFWTQILFYTVIGTHHFIFSAIPWWLQTVAIIGSVGMVIPVVAGTTNFLMTFKGAWFKLKDSYTLPFFLVGIIFYFTGSMQGTAEAVRTTNLFWHFTDFTVAHSHLTMYGIICFFIWGGIYAILPRLSGQEAPQITVGAHFWLALVGLMFYTVPLMYGGTLRGLMWMEGGNFIESVTFMAPYWLWRAIGGSLMWLSHIFFAYNIYKMVIVRHEVSIVDKAISELEKEN